MKSNFKIYLFIIIIFAGFVTLFLHHQQKLPQPLSSFLNQFYKNSPIIGKWVCHSNKLKNIWYFKDNGELVLYSNKRIEGKLTVTNSLHGNYKINKNKISWDLNILGFKVPSKKESDTTFYFSNGNLIFNDKKHTTIFSPLQEPLVTKKGRNLN